MAVWFNPYAGHSQYSVCAFRAMALLLAAYPAPLINDEFIAALWGDEPDGGPDNPAVFEAVALHHARMSLAQMGFRIEKVRHGVGGMKQLVFTPIEQQTAA